MIHHADSITHSQTFITDRFPPWFVITNDALHQYRPDRHDQTTWHVPSHRSGRTGHPFPAVSGSVGQAARYTADGEGDAYCRSPNCVTRWRAKLVSAQSPKRRDPMLRSHRSHLRNHRQWFPRRRRMHPHLDAAGMIKVSSLGRPAKRQCIRRITDGPVDKTLNASPPALICVSAAHNLGDRRIRKQTMTRSSVPSVKATLPGCHRAQQQPRTLTPQIEPDIRITHQREKLCVFFKLR